MHLEDKLETKVYANHPLLPWLTVWSCDVVNKYEVRAGRTAYSFMTGHKVKHAVYPFGQRIWGMLSADKNNKNARLRVVRGVLCGQNRDLLKLRASHQGSDVHGIDG